MNCIICEFSFHDGTLKKDRCVECLYKSKCTECGGLFHNTCLKNGRCITCGWSLQIGKDSGAPYYQRRVKNKLVNAGVSSKNSCIWIIIDEQFVKELYGKKANICNKCFLPFVDSIIEKMLI